MWNQFFIQSDKIALCKLYIISSLQKSRLISNFWSIDFMTLLILQWSAIQIINLAKSATTSRIFVIMSLKFWNLKFCHICFEFLQKVKKTIVKRILPGKAADFTFLYKILCVQGQSTFHWLISSHWTNDNK